MRTKPILGDITDVANLAENSVLANRVADRVLVNRVLVNCVGNPVANGSKPSRILVKHHIQKPTDFEWAIIQDHLL